MASLTDLISPNKARVDKQLEDNTLDNQATTEGPSAWDLAKTSAESSYMNNVGVSAVARVWDKVTQTDSSTYDENQLAAIYPDAPPKYFKGGATPFQAQLLYERFKLQQEQEQIQQFIYGTPKETQTDWWIGGKGGRDLIPQVTGLGAGFMDPLMLVAAPVGGKLAQQAMLRGIPAISQLAPNASKTLISAIGRSRFMSNIVPEVLGNFTADVAVTYPTKKLYTGEYTKEDTDFIDIMKNSIGTAVLFGTLKGVFKGHNVEFGNGIAKLQEVFDRHYGKNSDRAAANVGGDVHNEAVFKKAVHETVLDPEVSATTASDKMRQRAFSFVPDEPFPQEGKFYSMSDPETNNVEYLGNRYGDNVVLVDSMDAVHGMAKEYNVDGGINFDVHSLDGLTNGELKIADLEELNLQDHPKIMDLVTEEFGQDFVHALPDKATVKDLYELINNSIAKEESSGADISNLFDKMNNTLKEAGYDGISHRNEVGNAHNVVEVFQDRLGEGLTHEGSIQGEKAPSVEEAPTRPLESDITLADGQKIPATESPSYDPVYDLDQDFLDGYTKHSDTEYHMEFKDFDEKIADKLIDEKLKDIQFDIKESENTKLENAIEKIKQESLDSYPDKQDEILKALENCGRKV